MQILFPEKFKIIPPLVMTHLTHNTMKNMFGQCVADRKQQVATPGNDVFSTGRDDGL